MTSPGRTTCRCPQVPGGLTPEVGLSYSSGCIDGRTGNTNNQASWVGDGFDLSPGFIERRYKPCADDGATNADGEQARRPVLGATTTPPSPSTARAVSWSRPARTTFRLKQDDGTRIDRPDGPPTVGQRRPQRRVLARHHHRRHPVLLRLQPAARLGRAARRPPTRPGRCRSYGNDAGEPCHASDVRRLLVPAGLAVEPRLRRRPARQRDGLLLRPRRPTPTAATSRPPTTPATTAAATWTASSTA